MSNLNIKLSEAQILYDRGQIASYLTAMEAIIKDHPQGKALVHYQWGVSYQIGIGDGREARRMFLLALDELSSEILWDVSTKHEIEANAVENMLLLSQSFQEFDDWVNRLQTLGAMNTACQALRQSVLGNRKIDNPWYQTMMALAQTYHQPSAGRYGHAASIYDLLIRNRKEFGIPAEDYGEIIFNFSACKVQLMSSHGVRMHHSLQYTNPDEFNFIATEAESALTAYLDEYPGDRRIEGMLEKTKAAMNIPPQGSGPAPHAPIGFCLSWTLFLTGVILGAGLGRLVGGDHLLSYLVGGLIGFIVMVILVAVITYNKVMSSRGS